MTDDPQPLIVDNAQPPAQSPDRRSISHPKKPFKIARIDDDDDEEEEEERDRESIMNQNPRIQRYLVAIEYIGTRFFGCQKQPNCRTVVGALEDAFNKFIGGPVSVSCSSRTDAGVHALSNVCHVDVERISKRKPGEVLLPHEPAVVRKAVNHFLHKNEGGDLMVIDVRCVPADFHARYEARERTYFYRLLSGQEPLSSFEKDRAWHIPQDLDLVSIQKACRVLVGRHDFSSFRAAGCQAKSPIRNLDQLDVSEVVSTPFISNVDGNGSLNGETEQGFGIRRRHCCYVVTARGRSFLYHQVRLLVGVLKCVGTGELKISDVEKILKAKSVSAASPMAPACGLYLGRVKYDLF